MNDWKVSPDKYSPSNANGVRSESSIKKIHFAFNQEMRKSCIDDIAEKKKWVPGSNLYEPGHKYTSPRTIGNFTTTDHREVNSDATAHGMSVPANDGQVTNLEFYKRRAPVHDWNVSKSARFKPLPRTDVSPTYYKLDPAQKIVKPRAAAYTTGKDKNKNYLTKF